MMFQTSEWVAYHPNVSIRFFVNYSNELLSIRIGPSCYCVSHLNNLSSHSNAYPSIRIIIIVIRMILVYFLSLIRMGYGSIRMSCIFSFKCLSFSKSVRIDFAAIQMVVVCKPLTPKFPCSTSNLAINITITLKLSMLGWE